MYIGCIMSRWCAPHPARCIPSPCMLPPWGGLSGGAAWVSSKCSECVGGGGVVRPLWGVYWGRVADRGPFLCRRRQHTGRRVADTKPPVTAAQRPPRQPANKRQRATLQNILIYYEFIFSKLHINIHAQSVVCYIL